MRIISSLFKELIHIFSPPTHLITIENTVHSTLQNDLYISGHHTN